MKKVVLMLLGLTLLLTTSGFSADESGGYAGSFLRMGIGARPKAMGGAFTAVAEGSYAGYYNPAGLPFAGYKELTFNYRSMSLDRSLGFIGVSVPLHPSTGDGEKTLDAGFHVSWINAGVKNIDGRDTNGEVYDTFSFSENVFNFGFSIQPSKYVAIGFVGKLLYSRFPRVEDDDGALSSNGFAFDVGVLVRPLPCLSVGIVAKDLRAKYTWNTENVWSRGTTTYNDFLETLRVGIAWRGLQDRLLIAADFADNKKQDPKYYFGAEYRVLPEFLLRAGLDAGHPAAGMGYAFAVSRYIFVLDYAYIVDMISPSGEHVMGLSLRM
ncbi:hypothetical protein KAH55_09615 [bacterium]|nr:hypothetical protein [bacterium]